MSSTIAFLIALYLRSNNISAFFLFFIKSSFSSYNSSYEKLLLTLSIMFKFSSKSRVSCINILFSYSSLSIYSNKILFFSFSSFSLENALHSKDILTLLLLIILKESLLSKEIYVSSYCI